MKEAVSTPRTADGLVDHNAGWKLWTDMVKYYPSGVHRRRLVARWLEPLHPTTVLDVGCGPGHMVDELRQRLGESVQLIGVDNADETVAENRQRLPYARWEALDITAGKLPEKFDVVVCSEVLEHTV